MDYQKIYNNLITKRLQCQPKNEYTERHHIIPKCKNGSNEKSNLVKLTAREHFFAHLLLYKMETKSNYRMKLAYAINAMSNMKRDYQIGRKTSRWYSVARTLYIKEFSKKSAIMNAGKNNPMFGKKHSEESKLKMSINKKGQNMGDLNPAKRIEVRKKISDSKLGSKNPRAKKWKVIDPTGNIFFFHGGLKRELKKLGTTYMKAKNPANGWNIEQI